MKMNHNIQLMHLNMNLKMHLMNMNLNIKTVYIFNSNVTNFKVKIHVKRSQKLKNPIGMVSVWIFSNYGGHQNTSLLMVVGCMCV